MFLVLLSPLPLRILYRRGVEHTLEGMAEVGVVSEAALLGNLADGVLGIIRCEQVLRLVHADGKDIVGGSESCGRLYLSPELRRTQTHLRSHPFRVSLTFRHQLADDGICLFHELVRYGSRQNRLLCVRRCAFPFFLNLVQQQGDALLLHPSVSVLVLNESGYGKDQHDEEDADNDDDALPRGTLGDILVAQEVVAELSIVTGKALG